MSGILDKIDKTVSILDQTVARLQGVNYRGSSNLAETKARWNGDPSKKDWRVRLTIPPSANELRKAIFGVPIGGLLDPLNNPKVNDVLDESDGMFWPLTPSVIIQHSANYNALAQTHSNFPFQAYQNSQVDQINIIGEFPVQNSSDAKHWVATVHFLRTVTKMFFGRKQGQDLKGNPPPILFLNGYGDHVFKNVPVIVNTFNVELRSGIDYISTSQPNVANRSGSTYDATNEDEFTEDRIKEDNFDTTWAPSLSNISVLITPVYSRESVSNFSLNDFAVNGQFTVRGEKIGFI